VVCTRTCNKEKLWADVDVIVPRPKLLGVRTPSVRSSSSDDLLVPAVRLPSAYYWTSRLCRWRSHMERPTCRCHLSTISSRLQKTTKTASVSTLIKIIN